MVGLGWVDLERWFELLSGERPEELSYPDKGLIAAIGPTFCAPYKSGLRLGSVLIVLPPSATRSHNLRWEISAAERSKRYRCGSDSTRPSTLRTALPRPIQVPKGANADPQPDHAPEWKTRTAGLP